MAMKVINTSLKITSSIIRFVARTVVMIFKAKPKNEFKG